MKSAARLVNLILLSTMVSVSASAQSFNQPQYPNTGKKEDPCTALKIALPEPKIEVDDNGASSNQIRGYIGGVCLTEAGEYENGTRVQNIPVTQSAEFKRTPFSVSLRRSKGRELRVYNSQGGMASYPIPDPDDSSDPLGIGVKRPDEGESNEF